MFAIFVKAKLQKCSQKTRFTKKSSKKNIVTVFTIFWEMRSKFSMKKLENFYEKGTCSLDVKNCFAVCDLLSNNNKVTPSIMHYATFFSVINF